MKYFRNVLIFLMTVTACNTAPQIPVNAHYKRVVVLGQTPLELLLALGLKDRIAGIAYLDNPEHLQGYDSLPVLSRGWVDKESVLALQPDLIFALESAFRTERIGSEAFWHHRGIKTCIIDNYNQDKNEANYRADIRKTGTLLHMEEQTDSMIRHLECTATKYARPRAAAPRVLHLSYAGSFGQFYYYPPTMCLLDEVVEKCGGNYVNLGKQYFILPLEAIIQANPDKIIITQFRKQAGVNIAEQLYDNPFLQYLRVIQKREILEVDYTEAIRGTTDMETIYSAVSKFLQL
ncbi:ABC transporter substrate-binding protein [Chitinophaga nivalis]|uniref:ABC transporter substrate-binding protein n=1 Tax=Chitinophaga nivalis TaxID=2991709 RepID=A0ABT3ING8_9BACT|nr:ABC transporter substrate-binding protein [Chitinophaga nivalis]MCW3464788.1 ABC transporter substrate-binding protein [Chitinophaga nivalis]MCW3485521.1 ABC transporter substrate-binding protein [Chitinophaga nivalis]